ncbi:MAG: hypothetical protein WA782_14810 [Sulfitobacter sp.]
MRNTIRYVILAALAVPSAVGADVPERFATTFTELVNSAEKSCSSFENGTLTVSEIGVQSVVDFNGDGVTDPIIDSGSFNCSSAATLFGGGSGGRDIYVFVSTPDAGYQRFDFLAEGSITLSLGQTSVLLLAVHGANCDLTGAENCFVAYRWANGAFHAAGGHVTANSVD